MLRRVVPLLAMVLLATLATGTLAHPDLPPTSLGLAKLHETVQKFPEATQTASYKPVLAPLKYAVVVKPKKRTNVAPTHSTASRGVTYKGSIPTLVRKLTREAGFGACCAESMVKLCKKESGFRPGAVNPNGKYFGLFQLNSGMASGNDWSNPTWNTKRALEYIRSRYGDPCGAWAHSRSYNWY